MMDRGPASVLVEVGLAQSERLAEPQPAAPKQDDHTAQPCSGRIVAGCAHDCDDLLDGWGISWISQDPCCAMADLGGRWPAWPAPSSSGTDFMVSSSKRRWARTHIVLVVAGLLDPPRSVGGLFLAAHGPTNGRAAKRSRLKFASSNERGGRAVGVRGWSDRLSTRSSEGGRVGPTRRFARHTRRFCFHSSAATRWRRVFRRAL
jgi:hypothetical protein